MQMKTAVSAALSGLQLLLVLLLVLGIQASDARYPGEVDHERNLYTDGEAGTAKTCESRSGKETGAGGGCPSAAAAPAALPSTYADFPGAAPEGKETLYSMPMDSSQELEAVNTGVLSAQQLRSLIVEKAFPKVLDFIGSKGGPITGAVTSILKLIIGGIGGGGEKVDSEILVFARKSFAEINDKLDSFTHEFHQVKELIDWNAVQVSYGTYERSVRALKAQLKMLLEAPPASVQDLRQLFIAKFESDFQNAAEKIYDGIVSDDLIFSQNLLEASAKFSGNNRGQVQVFSMGLMQLLLQAVQVQMAYFDLKYANEETTDYTMAVWSNRTAVLTAKMASFDIAVKDRWQMQVTLDADELVLKHRAMGNHDLAMKLYSFLSEKFYWRWFGLVVYDDVKGRHAFFYCQGYQKLGVSGKNIVFASIDKEKSTFEKMDAMKLLYQLQSNRVLMLPDAKSTLKLLKIYEKETGGQCKSNQLMLVVYQHVTNQQVVAATDHFLMQTVCERNWVSDGCYDVVLFG